MPMRLSSLSFSLLVYLHVWGSPVTEDELGFTRIFRLLRSAQKVSEYLHCIMAHTHWGPTCSL